MAKNLSLGTIVEKNKIASDVPFLALLKVEVIDPADGSLVQTLRFAKNNEDITFDGNLYVKADFDLDVKAEAGAVPDVSLSVVDYTRSVQSYMQQYGGGVGFNVTLYVVDTSNLAGPPEMSEHFEVMSATTSGYVVSWTLGAENALSLNFPKRRQMRDRCSWRYKSAECGYTGNMGSCDLTLRGSNGCEAHGNALNFGGFPGINPSGQSYA